jgi:hypothetical protein
MSQQDVWDAEDAELRRAFAEKDAEIERLKEDLQKAHNCIMRQRETEERAWIKVEDQETLIRELADALEIHSSTYPGAPIEKLIQRAKEANE